MRSKEAAIFVLLIFLSTQKH
uniref:Uncharacterized protein n=1 Tax=Anguilla anguilla TaxID=7936 RepID=A0A0E9XDB8_ANGAN